MDEYYREMHNVRRRRDITGALGTGLGIFNGMDPEVLVNKLDTATSDLHKLEHPS